MKNTPSALRTLEGNYQSLRQSLAHIGYISQGSVLDRSTLKVSAGGQNQPSVGESNPAILR